MTAIFITPLAAKASVRNWELTCKLLRESLFSLEQQTSGNFRSLICCHDIPAFAAELDERFSFVIHPYDPPSSAYQNSGKHSGIRDMMLKRDVALRAANPKDDDFVILLDADDLFHEDLVKGLEQRQDTDAALFEHGYEYCQRSHRLLRRRDMVGRTTSSFALRGRLVRTPTSNNEEDLKKSIYHEVWHSNVRRYIESNHLSMWEPHEPTVIYRVNTTLNRSDWYRVSKIRRWRHNLKFLLGRKVSASERSAFGLEKFLP